MVAFHYLVSLGYKMVLTHTHTHTHSAKSFHFKLFLVGFSKTYQTHPILLNSWNVRAKLLQSCPTLCDPMNCKPSRLLCPWGSPGKNIGIGLPRPPPGDLPYPRIKPMFLMTPVLASRQVLYHQRHLGTPTAEIVFDYLSVLLTI